MIRPYKTDVNPNDTPGGGGCLCHSTRGVDTHGPYIVFPGTEMDNALSPFPVLCAGCIPNVLDTAEGETLSGGERGNVDVVDGTAEEDVQAI